VPHLAVDPQLKSSLPQVVQDVQSWTANQYRLTSPYLFQRRSAGGFIYFIFIQGRLSPQQPRRYSPTSPFSPPFSIPSFPLNLFPS